MTSVAVIELGSDWAPREAVRSPRARRRALAAVLLVAAVLPAGGSAPARPTVRAVASLPARVGDTFALAGDRAYVLGTAPDGTPLLRGYRLPDGAPLWTAGIGGSAGTLRAVPQAGVLLVQAAAGDAGQVVALDAGTGRVLWRLPDASVLDVAPRDGRGLLSVRASTGTPGVREVDLGSGAVVWSRDLAGHMNVAVAAPGRVVFLAADGEARAVDERTGEQLLTGRLPTAVGGTAGLYPAGGQLFVTDARSGSTLVTAYDPLTLARRWDASVSGLVYYVDGCGPAVCVSGPHASVVLDAATGSVRWYSGAWRAAGLVAGRVLASMVTATGALRTVLLDPSEGGIVLDLARWAVVDGARPGAALLVGDESGRLGAWVATLDGDFPTVHPVSWLPGAVKDGCQLAGPYLACATYGGPVRIWRYLPPGGAAATRVGAVRNPPQGSPRAGLRR